MSRSVITSNMLCVVIVFRQLHHARPGIYCSWHSDQLKASCPVSSCQAFSLAGNEPCDMHVVSTILPSLGGSPVFHEDATLTAEWSISTELTRTLHTRIQNKEFSSTLHKHFLLQPEVRQQRHSWRCNPYNLMMGRSCQPEQLLAATASGVLWVVWMWMDVLSERLYVDGHWYGTYKLHADTVCSNK